MCGISGIVNFNQAPVSEGPLRQMMETMKYRGIDDSGVFTDRSVGFGYVRLSIIDLSMDAHQPMEDSTGRYVLVFNGEIFNYLELKEELKSEYSFKTKSDSEVLLAAYIVWGKACLDKFNGMWAFAIYDKLEQTVFLARDRFGEKPLYYYQTKNEFIFASDIKAIQSIVNQNFTPNDRIIFEFLAYNRTDQDCDTFVKEVKRLQHGYFAVLTKETVKFERWYNLIEKTGDTFRDTSEYKSLLTSSIGLRLRSDVPIGVCLSGGLDSSSVVSTITKEFKRNDISTFSAIYGDGLRGDESKFIDLYKKDIRNMHLIRPTEQSLLEDFDSLMDCHFEPFGSLSIYSQFKVMKELSRSVKVALDGQGADEQLAGYHNFFSSNFRGLLNQFKFRQFVLEVYWYLKKHNSSYALRFLTFYMLPNALKNTLVARRSGVINPDLFELNRHFSRINEQLYDPRSLQQSLLQHFEYKLEHNLKWNDLNSMYFSVELRAPFMDYRLVEKTIGLPSNLVINRGTTKWILRQAMQGVLPEDIRIRQDKVGFENPAHLWLKSSKLQARVNEIMIDKNNDVWNYFERNGFAKKYKRYLKNETDMDNEVWKLINLDVFLNRIK